MNILKQYKKTKSVKKLLLSTYKNFIYIKYNIKFKLNTISNYIRCRFRYESVSSPSKTILIDPSDIEKFQTPEYVKYKNGSGGLGQVLDGDWDKNARNLNESPKINGLQQYFLKGKDWNETTYYERLYKRYDNDEKIKKRLGDVENLYNSLKNNGYIRGVSDSILYRDQLDLLIVVGRDGEIILLDGYHRFVIAKALNIEIPTQIICRHKLWQELRDNVYNKGISEEHDDELRNHPDLQDILD